MKCNSTQRDGDVHLMKVLQLLVRIHFPLKVVCFESTANMKTSTLKIHSYMAGGITKKPHTNTLYH